MKKLSFSDIQHISVLGDHKFPVFMSTLDMVENIDGDMAELGVWRGGTALTIKSRYPNKKLHLFDSFEGLRKPEHSFERHNEKDFSDTNLDDVKDLFKDFEDVFIYKGWFPETLTEELMQTRFSFVHLDGDFYQSTFDAINFFYPRMSHNGIILLDDYCNLDANGEEATPGVAMAIKELAVKFQYFWMPIKKYQAIIINK